jgi:UDP-N-acetyl-D-mannosaminuronic acid dehydrogenase
MLAGGAVKGVLGAALDLRDSMPRRVVEHVKRNVPLKGVIVGILGIAFKAETDDCRDSPASEVATLFEAEGATVISNDPCTTGSSATIDEVIAKSDVLVIATPHNAYRGLSIPKEIFVVDPWGLLAAGSPVGNNGSCDDKQRFSTESRL